MIPKKPGVPKRYEDSTFIFNGEGSRKFFDNRLLGDWTIENYALQFAGGDDDSMIRHQFVLDTDWLATRDLPRDIVSYIHCIQKVAKDQNKTVGSRKDTAKAGDRYVFTGTSTNFFGKVGHASIVAEAGPSDFPSSQPGSSSRSQVSRKQSNEGQTEQLPKNQAVHASNAKDATGTPDAADTAEEAPPIPPADPTLYQDFLNRWMINCVKNSGYELLRDEPAREAGNNKQILQKLSHHLLSKFEDNSLTEMCALRLSLSYVVSAVNNDIANIFKESAGDLKWNELFSEEHVPDELDTTIENLTKEICEPLERNIPNAVCALIIINEKRLEQLRLMEQVGLNSPTPTLIMRVLDIYEYIINNVDRWAEMNSSKDTSENDYLSETHTIFNILLRGDVDLIAKTGEITAIATKNARDYMKQKYDVDPASNVYGRKLDMLVARKKGFDLTAIEWKKKTTDDKQLLLQQCKNIRVNKCNLSTIQQLPILPENIASSYVIEINWRGFCGYMFMIKKVHGVYTAKKVGLDMWLPTHLKLVKHFDYTLKMLLFWKSHLETLCQMIDIGVAMEHSTAMNGVAGPRILKRERSDSDFTYMSPKKSR